VTLLYNIMLKYRYNITSTHCYYTHYKHIQVDYWSQSLHVNLPQFNSNIFITCWLIHAEPKLHTINCGRLKLCNKSRRVVQIAATGDSTPFSIPQGIICKESITVTLLITGWLAKEVIYTPQSQVHSQLREGKLCHHKFEKKGIGICISIRMKKDLY
jgi:hypothetical protein